MTKRELTSIALKFFALYLLVDLLNILVVYGYSTVYTVWNWLLGGGHMFPEVNSGQQILMIAIGLLAVSLPLLMAWLLWKLANKLSESVESEETKSDSANSFDNVVIMLVGVGLLITITAFPQVLNSTQSLIHQSSIDKGTDAGTVIWLIGSLIELFLGISLVLGRNGWRRLIFKIRYEPMYSNKSRYKDED